MNNPKSYNIWLEEAYLLFAEEGLENFSIKVLAKKCGLPRTNFYYYFQDKEEIIDRIIDLHFVTTTETFNEELENRMQIYIPDLYLIVYDFKLGVQFTKQLFKNREIQKFNEAYKKGIALSADLIIPKFKDFFKIDLPDEAVKSLWYTVVDTWYSRLNFNNYTVDTLIASCYDIMNTILPLFEKENNLKSKLQHSFDTPV